MGLNTGRRSTAPRLSQRGVGVVAVVAGGLVLLASAGHTGAALLGAVALYALLTGRVAAVANVLPTARQALRGLCWAAVALAVSAAQGSTAPGGATLGLALAVALATALRLTSRKGR